MREQAIQESDEAEQGENTWREGPMEVSEQQEHHEDAWHGGQMQQSEQRDEPNDWHVGQNYVRRHPTISKAVTKHVKFKLGKSK